MAQYPGLEEIYERVMVRKIAGSGGALQQGAIPIEVGGVFLNAALGSDGILHLDLGEIQAAVDARIEQAQSEVVSVPPNPKSDLSDLSGQTEGSPKPRPVPNGRAKPKALAR